MKGEGRKHWGVGADTIWYLILIISLLRHPLPNLMLDCCVVVSGVWCVWWGLLCVVCVHV